MNPKPDADDGCWGQAGAGVQAIACEVVRPHLFKDNGDRGMVFIFEGEMLVNIRFRDGGWSIPPTAEHEAAADA